MYEVVPKCPKTWALMPKCLADTSVCWNFTMVSKCPMNTLAPLPRCLGSEVSIHPSVLCLYCMVRLIVFHFALAVELVCVLEQLCLYQTLS